MALCKPVDSTNEKRRQAQLRAWFIERETTQVEFAKRVGVSPSYLCLLLQGKRNNSKVFKALLEEGVPANLLPKPFIQADR